MPKTIEHVAIYCRTSSDNQKDNRTIESQLHANRKYCEDQGWNVLDEYLDDGLSGTTLIAERPDAKRLFANLGKYHAIVMTEDSRLTRTEDEEEQGRIQKALRLSGVYTVLTFEKAIEDASTFGARIIRAIKMMVSAEERKKILARTKEGMDRARRENRHVGGYLPHGLCWIGTVTDENGVKTEVNEWRVNEQELQTLQKAMELVKEGHVIQTVVDFFNNNLTLYPSRRKRWSHSVLWQMLCRQDFYYTGELKNGVDTGIRLFHQEEVEHVRKLIRLNRRNNGRRDMPKEPDSHFLLKRLIRCTCGWFLSSVTNNDGKDRYYRCKKCRYGLRADDKDQEVWERFTTTFKDKEKLREAVKVGDYAIGTEETRKAKAILAEAELALEQVSTRKREIIRLLSDPASALVYDELKKSLIDLGQKAEEAKSMKQDALVTLANPEKMDKAIEAARKSVLRQLEKVGETIATFYTHKEARLAGQSVNDVLRQVREQKRAILKAAISKDKDIIVNRNGDIVFPGSFLLASEIPKSLEGTARNG